MWTISIISLAIVTALCFFGVFHGAFKDNLLQCLGMAVVTVGACGRIWQLWLSNTSDGLVVLYLGLAIYALGTLSKVLVYRGRERGWRMVLDVDHWLAERKTGAGAFDSKPHHHV